MMAYMVNNMVIVRWRRREMYQAWEAWGRVMRCARGVAQLVASRTLARWAGGVQERKDSAKEERIERRVQGRAVSRWRCRCVARAWHRWCAAQVVLKRGLVLGRKALSRWRLRGTAAAWCRWVSAHAWHQASARLCTLAARGQCRRQRREYGRALRAWKQHVDQIARNKCMASRVCARWMQQKLAQAWTPWREQHGTHVRLKQLSTRIRRRAAHDTASLFCSAWHQECVQRKRLMRQARHLLCRWSHIRRVLALDRWQEQAALQCRQRATATRIIQLWTRRTLARAWRRWCLVVARYRVARKACGRWLHSSTRKGFETWRAHVANTAAHQCRHAALCSLALRDLARRHMQVKARALRCWRALALHCSPRPCPASLVLQFESKVKAFSLHLHRAKAAWSMSRVCCAWRELVAHRRCLRPTPRLCARATQGVYVHGLRLLWEAFSGHLRRALRLRRLSCRRMQGYTVRFLARVLNIWGCWLADKVLRAWAAKSAAAAAARSRQARVLRRLRSSVVHVCACVPASFGHVCVTCVACVARPMLRNHTLQHSSTHHSLLPAHAQLLASRASSCPPAFCLFASVPVCCCLSVCRT